ncbi:hypothetical protein HF086_007805, partial [Spodoptera exigua]
MAPSPLCAGCHQKTLMKESIPCSMCKCRYDFDCAGISKDFFNKKMTVAQKSTWQCPSCMCKMPKNDNTNTPISASRHLTDLSDGGNVTTMKITTPPNEDSVSFDDSNIVGDTQITQKTPVKISMQNLSELVMSRLKENNKTLVEELQNTIHTEINKAIAELRQDFDYKTRTLTQQNKERKQELDIVTTKLKYLETENTILKQQILELSSQNFKNANFQESNMRKVVLYGLADYTRESESDLYNRLIELFYDITNVDLSGYIEDIYRIGRKNTKNRPLVIELI